MKPLDLILFVVLLLFALACSRTVDTALTRQAIDTAESIRQQAVHLHKAACEASEPCLGDEACQDIAKELDTQKKALEAAREALSNGVE